MFFLYRTVMFFGSWVCHQLPERSPHAFGLQLPLCWRCSGIVVGSIVLLVWLTVRKKLPPLALSAALSLLLPLDVLLTVVTGSEGDNARRFSTGVLWGIFGVGASLHLIKYVSDRIVTRRLAAGTRG
jgi:uncharacterized membrane protein